VFVNSKSGDNLGVKFLRRFKQLINPAQVFDLMNGGPRLGLRLFRTFNPFRILVCGGDGSVGWVLLEIDKLNMQHQCHVGILPLGTGNDLARVLGWGSVCDDDAHLPQLLDKYEKASTKMLDRWSIMAYESGVPHTRKPSTEHIASYEDSVADQITRILQSDQYSVVIESASKLCTTVKDFLCRVGEAYGEVPEESLSYKCVVLKEKLDMLLKTLSEEAQASTHSPPDNSTDAEKAHLEKMKSRAGITSKGEKDAANHENKKKTSNTRFIARESLMCRANSLKKAVRHIVEHAEKTLDEQNALTRREEESAASPPLVDRLQMLTTIDSSCDTTPCHSPESSSLVKESPQESPISKHPYTPDSPSVSFSQDSPVRYPALHSTPASPTSRTVQQCQDYYTRRGVGASRGRR